MMFYGTTAHRSSTSPVMCVACARCRNRKLTYLSKDNGDKRTRFYLNFKRLQYLQLLMTGHTITGISWSFHIYNYWWLATPLQASAKIFMGPILYFSFKHVFVGQLRERLAQPPAIQRHLCISATSLNKDKCQFSESHLFCNLTNNSRLPISSSPSSSYHHAPPFVSHRWSIIHIRFHMRTSASKAGIKGIDQ